MGEAVFQWPGLDLRIELTLPTQCIPENRVDETFLMLPGEIDSFVDGGVVGDAGAEDLVETNPENVLGRRLDPSSSEFSMISSTRNKLRMVP